MQDTGVAVNTIPMRGLQYLTSPSLPGPVQKMLASSSREGTLQTSMNNTNTLLPAVKDAIFDKEFDGTLAGIGPSARRLLLLDAEGEGDAGNTTMGGTGTLGSRRQKKRRQISLERKGIPRESATLNTYSTKIESPRKGHHQQSLAHTVPSARGGGAKMAATEDSGRRPKPQLASTLTSGAQTATLSGTMTRQRNRQLTGDGVRDVPAMNSTLVRNPQSEPPLVVTLRQYLSREVRLAQDGCPAPSPLDQIGPYREAFGAFIAAFPGYQAILSDIQSAYDNVIQCQAELLSDVHSKELEVTQRSSRHQEELTTLQTLYQNLETELKKAHNELEERSGGEAAAGPRRGVSSAGLSTQYELKRQLEQAQARQAELEGMSKGDLEKIMILIGALRECDKRMKALELSVKNMSGQVEELEEFKRLAAEAQSELQQYKERYGAYVPLCDFGYMKSYLMEELAAAQNTARRMRRTAVVRGTQVDVMSRRLQLLDSEVKQLKEASAGDAGSCLTPRPSWTSIQTELPELGEYVKKVHCAPLVAKEGDAGNESEGECETNEDGEILIIEGPINSNLRVQYLVDRLKALQKRVDELESDERAALAEKQQEKAHHLATVGISGKAANGADGATSGRSHGGGSSRVSTKGRGGAQEVGPVAFQRPMPVPIVGPGLGQSVPRYLRATGIIDRSVVDPVIATELVFEFFSTVVQPAAADQELFANLNLSELLATYLTTQVNTRDTLIMYPCGSHLALNLEEDARDPQLTTPPTFLLSSILRGVMPLRLGIDAAMMAARVIKDLNALAAEQHKSRIRRQAVGECIQPVLELKSSEEIAELRQCLGSDATFDVVSLTSMQHRFMRALLYQECQENMAFYTSALSAVSRRAERDVDANGERLITLANIADSIIEVEPLTPSVVVRELSENAIGNTEDAATSVDGESLVKLSEVIRAIGEAPLLRRTARLTREECAL